MGDQVHAARQDLLHVLAHDGAVVHVIDQSQVRAVHRLDDVERQRRADEIHRGEQLGVERFEHERHACVLGQHRGAAKDGDGIVEMLLLRHPLDPEARGDDQRRRADLLRLCQRVADGLQHFLVLGRIDDRTTRIYAEASQRTAGLFQRLGDARHVLVTPEMELHPVQPCVLRGADAFGKAVAGLGELPFDAGRKIGHG